MATKDCAIVGGSTPTSPTNGAAATLAYSSPSSYATPASTGAAHAQYAPPNPEDDTDEDRAEAIIVNYPPGANTVIYTQFSIVYNHPDQAESKTPTICGEIHMLGLTIFEIITGSRP